jgi:hypothetical protein
MWGSLGTESEGNMGLFYMQAQHMDRFLMGRAGGSVLRRLV